MRWIRALSRARLAVASIGLVAFACTRAPTPTPEHAREPASTHADPEPPPPASATGVQILSVPTGDGLTLRRTMCFGKCPAYQLTLRPNGTLEWWGFADVARTGPARDLLAVGEVTRLMAEFERLAAVQHAHALGFVCTDTPTTTITLTRGQTQSSLTTDHCDEAKSAPLSRIADLIDAAAQTKRWIADDACKPRLSSVEPEICFGPAADLDPQDAEDCERFVAQLMKALHEHADAHVRVWAAAGARSAHERVERAHAALVGRGIAEARIHRYLFPEFAEDPDGWDDGTVTVEVGSAACMRIDP